MSQPPCELKTLLAGLQNQASLNVPLLFPGGFVELSIHLSTSIFPSVHLSTGPRVCVPR